MFKLFAMMTLLTPLPALAEGWDWLSRPGVAVLMRHAIAPGIGDPPGFRLDDPATQRNLDDRGRAQARAIGAAIRAAGVEVDAVLTSRWNRARETAELLAVGPVEASEALDSFFQNRGEAAARTRALTDLLRARAGRERLVLVTHQVNISALLGRGLGSGDAVAVAVEADGLRVLGVIAAPD